MKELFLEQLRVIDSHPYENVGDDGRPLIDGESVIPDYETIFVKGTEVQRYRTEVQMYRGTEVQRYRGTAVQRVELRIRPAAIPEPTLTYILIRKILDFDLLRHKICLLFAVIATCRPKREALFRYKIMYKLSPSPA